MKIVCVDNCLLRDGVKVSNLTPGKVYDLPSRFQISLNSEDDWNERILIVNDKGVKEWYNNELFIPLHKYRELRLNEIGI